MDAVVRNPAALAHTMLAAPAHIFQAETVPAPLLSGSCALCCTSAHLGMGKARIVTVNPGSCNSAPLCELRTSHAST